jgi:hypothetical protein
MMLSLVANIIQHPRQISRSEGHNSVAGLPFEELAIRNFIIDVMRACAFQPAYPLANEQRWRDTYNKMNMIVRATDAMKNATVRLYDVMLDVLLHSCLNEISQDGRIVLRMPYDVEVDFRIHIAWHRLPLVAKALCEKPVKTG